MAKVDPLSPTAPRALPFTAQLLIADRCNHACEHCYQVHGDKGEMSLPEIEAILGALARAGVLFLHLSGGEATLRSDLPEILRAARARRFAITLLTNGYALSEQVLEAIVATGVWEVRLSVYSDVAAEHDAVTRVPGSFERTIGSIRALRARGVQVTAVVPLTSHCSADARRLLALGDELDCPVEIASLITAKEDGTTSSQRVSPTRAQLDAYFAEEARRGVAIGSIEDKLEQPPCGACSRMVTVHSNGSVRPCTHIPVELRDARHDGEAVASVAEEPAFQLFTGLRWRDLHGCRDCALVAFCSRCHGSALAERGDLLGPQPSACRQAIARFEARHGRPAHATTDAGPFELGEDGALRPIPDRITEADEALARDFPWIRARGVRSPALVPASRLNQRRIAR